MNIQDQIAKSETLIQWMDQRIDGLEISSDDRTRVSAACLDVALEHQKAIVLLVRRGLFGSALSLARSTFEAYVRGTWLGRCASEAEIERYKEDKLEKSFGTLVKELEQIDGFNEGVLSRAKTANWSSLSSYTHTGFLQSVRRNKADTIEPDYDPEEVVGLLCFADAIAMLTALQVARLAGNESLARELLDKSTENVQKA